MKYKAKKLEFFLNSENIVFCNNGLEDLDKKWKWDTAIAPYNRLYFIPNGEGGWLLDENEKLYMKAGHCYLIPSNYKFGFGNDGTFKQLFFHFNLKKDNGFDVFESFGRFGELEMHEDCAIICENFMKEDVASMMTVESIIYKAISCIAKKYNYSLDLKTDYSQIVKSAITYIEDHLSPKLTSADIAEKCHVSKSSLTKHFRQEMGMSVKEYIMSIIMNEAKLRLLGSNDKITDISAALGFTDQYIFSRCFTKINAISPSAFRKNYKF